MKKIQFTYHPFDTAPTSPKPFIQGAKWVLVALGIILVVYYGYMYFIESQPEPKNNLGDSKDSC